jgi:hypothetical protein
MVIMSDFQLITGLSMMISGFTQLPCGISMADWQNLVYMTWLTSVTHLCCLTYLRDHFCQHRIALIWRLPGMVALVIMLLVALVPTRSYWVNGGLPEYAICYFTSANNLRDYKEDPLEVKDSETRMILSAILLGVGMLSRIWRLYEAPARACMRLRMRCDFATTRLLQMMSLSTRLQGPLAAVGTILLDRPLLAVVLSGKILLEILFSKMCEVRPPYYGPHTISTYKFRLCCYVLALPGVY